MTADITVVYVGPASPLQQIAEQAGWRLEVCRTWKGALDAAERLGATVVIYDRDANPDGWQKALRRTLHLSARPSFLLVSRFADERMWAELLDNGGYDLLTAPLEAHEVVRTVDAAHGHRSRSLAAGVR